MTPIQPKNAKPVLAGSTIEVTAIVLTCNEEEFVEECLFHLKPYVDCLLVLDGFSSDNTINIARKIATGVIVRLFKGSFAEERNYAQERAPTNWVLHCDADERFPKFFLEKMKKTIIESNVKCFRFPRVNFDQAYPRQLHPEDHQVRLLDKRFGNWVRPVHEIVWSHQHSKPLDQCGDMYIKTLPYPIVHLIRPKTQRENILERWKTLEHI